MWTASAQLGPSLQGCSLQFWLFVLSGAALCTGGMLRQEGGCAGGEALRACEVAGQYLTEKTLEARVQVWTLLELIRFLWSESQQAVTSACQEICFVSSNNLRWTREATVFLCKNRNVNKFTC